MSKAYIDPNIAQTGLDSGALTMLGAVVHRFEEPGEYRGTIRHGDAIEKVFYLSVDKESPVAAANLDLAKLTGSMPHQHGTHMDCRPVEGDPRFFVNPRGYVLFHVSGGRGGYSVNVRRADPHENTAVFKSTVLDGGAVFSARVLRPGTYSVANAHDQARASLTVAYPPRAFSGYRPPDALRVEVTERGFRPEGIELMSAQGLIFDCRTPARIVIKLERPDDGPSERAKAT